MDDNNIIKELFEKRAKMVSQKDNKELNSKILNLDIAEKENEIIGAAKIKQFIFNITTLMLQKKKNINNN